MISFVFSINIVVLIRYLLSYFRNKTCAGKHPPRSPPVTVKPTYHHPVSTPHPGPCHPKCGKYGGECDKKLKKCLCCWGWSGPGAHYGKGKNHNRIYAKYCDDVCFYHQTHK